MTVKEFFKTVGYCRRPPTLDELCEQWKQIFGFWAIVCSEYSNISYLHSISVRLKFSGGGQGW